MYYFHFTLQELC